MKTSAAMDLVWQMATQEAIAGEFAEIEPEHFLAAILKFAELPVEQMGNLDAPVDVAKEIAADVGKVRDELKRRAINSTRRRRELRARLGKGGRPHDGGQIHRSQASREMFDGAARLAGDEGSEVLAPEHLLQALLLSPSQKVCDVLGDAVMPKGAERVPTPLLDHFGQNLVQAAAEGRLAPAFDRPVECKALLQLLADPRRRSVLLVTDHDEAALSVVTAAARAMSSDATAAGLASRRIVEVAGWKPRTSGAGKCLPDWEQLFAEVTKVQDVILLVPAIEAANNPKQANPWAELLKKMLLAGPVQCICRVNATAYQRWIRKDRGWKQAAHVMWVHETSDDGIPTEL